MTSRNLHDIEADDPDKPVSTLQRLWLHGTTTGRIDQAVRPSERTFATVPIPEGKRA